MKASDLIGKNAIRTKPMNIGNGLHDYSLTSSPIHIINATDSHIIYEYLPEYDRILAEKKRILDCRWCDDNWIDFEFILTPVSDQLVAFDGIDLGS